MNLWHFDHARFCQCLQTEGGKKLKKEVCVQCMEISDHDFLEKQSNNNNNKSMNVSKLKTTQFRITVGFFIYLHLEQSATRKVFLPFPTTS